MLNKLAKLALVSTALAPICLTLWFVEISSVWESALPFVDNFAAHWQAGSGYLLSALLLSGGLFRAGKTVGFARHGSLYVRG